MPIPVPYTSNYTDHSTDAGYQFEFICEHCHNGYKSGFKTNPLGIGTKVARGFGSMFSQTLSNVGYSGGMLQDMTESQAKDKALREAIAECAPLFNQCHRCGSWVCKEICWNDEFNLCVFCTPQARSRDRGNAVRRTHESSERQGSRRRLDNRCKCRTEAGRAVPALPR